MEETVGVNFVLNAATTSIGVFMPRSEAERVYKMFQDGTCPYSLGLHNVKCEPGTGEWLVVCGAVAGLHKLVKPPMNQQGQQVQQGPPGGLPPRPFPPLGVRS